MQWTMTSFLEDFDPYADYLGIQSDKRQDRQNTKINKTASTTGLMINDKKTQVLCKTASSNNPVSQREATGGFEGVYLPGQ